MLPRADLNSPRPPASVEATTPAASATDARQEVFRRLTQIAIGREVQVSVDSVLDDGTHLVKIADVAARMALPAGTKAGDLLSMVFIAREPRPTFLLTGQQGSAPASLSAAARLIDHLLQAAARDGTANAVQARTPLLGAAASDPQQLAQALRNGVVSSGLFYESHLLDWINGSRSLTELADEPQFRFGASQSLHAQDANQSEMARLAAGMQELGKSAHKLLELIRDAQLQSAGKATDADVVARSADALPALDPEAARLVNQQLNALERQQIRWQGELWPGQEMEWEIREDKPGGGSHDAGEPVWSSVVRFELPHLGEVSANIRLAGDRVQVQVTTRDEDAATSLRTHGELLADALAAAGSPLDSLLVKRDEKNA